jgi:hypothetical protein
LGRHRFAEEFLETGREKFIFPLRRTKRRSAMSTPSAQWLLGVFSLWFIERVGTAQQSRDPACHASQENCGEANHSWPPTKAADLIPVLWQSTGMNKTFGAN